MWIRRIKLILVGVLVGMMVVRSGVFTRRIVGDWVGSKQAWQPANENEQMILKNYFQVGE